MHKLTEYSRVALSKRETVRWVGMARRLQCSDKPRVSLVRRWKQRKLTRKRMAPVVVSEWTRTQAVGRLSRRR